MQPRPFEEVSASEVEKKSLSSASVAVSIEALLVPLSVSSDLF